MVSAFAPKRATPKPRVRTAHSDTLANRKRRLYEPAPALERFYETWATTPYFCARVGFAAEDLERAQRVSQPR